jgi:PAS domain S-box-containing protein
VGLRLARTLEAITDAFYTLDRQWRFTFVNAEAERIQERTRAQLLGRVVWEVFPEAIGTAFDIEFHRAMETGETALFESYYPPLDLWVAVRAFPSEDGLAVYFLDIKAQRAAAESLARSEGRYRALFERAGDAILIADDSGRYIDANESAATLLGVDRSAIVGQKLNDFLVDAPNAIEADAAWAAVRAVGEMRGEIRLRRSDGEILETEYSVVADISPGLHLGVIRDITDRRHQERATVQRDRIVSALRRLTAGDDPEVTADAICREIAHDTDIPSAAIYSLGSEDRVTALGAHLRDGRGVEVLPPISPKRLAMMRAQAAAGPWIGEVGEPERSTNMAKIAALGLRSAAYAPIVSDGRLVAVLVAGFAEAPDLVTGRLSDLMVFAALTSSLLGPGLRHVAERTAERARIRAIISERAFAPVFQPIVELRTGAVLGYEALTRFADGTPPDRVFHQAAEVGVGLELEAWTIHAALAASATLCADVFLDINVSPELVMAGEPLLSLLERAPGGGVVLEITEHVGVEDYAVLRDGITALGDHVRFAVDDAGAGFASLRHILELSPAYVKLDRALIARIDTDPARQALVAGMVHFTGKTDGTLIAEGIETVEERDALVELGVDVGQGYLLGRPAPAA